MADSTGVQVFVGPANQLELGDVITGPAAVTLETIDDSHQRINFSIPSPTQELVDANNASAAAAASSATAAAGSKTAADSAAASAAAAVTQAANSAASAAGSLTAANNSAASAAASATAAAQAAAPTDAQWNAIVTAKLLPSNLALDTDGVPYINPGANSVFVYADTDGRPYFVS